MNKQPVHPGAILREVVLPEINISKAELARKAHISRTTLYRLLEEKEPVRVATALKFAKLFGNSADFWLNLQTKYDIWHTEREMKNELKQINKIA